MLYSGEQGIYDSVLMELRVYWKQILKGRTNKYTITQCGLHCEAVIGCDEDVGGMWRVAVQAQGTPHVHRGRDQHECGTGRGEDRKSRVWG